MSKSACFVALFALMIGPSLAAQPTWNGKISDSHCGAKHNMASMTDRACTEMCIKGKGKYVFVLGGKSYQILGPTDKPLASHAGQTVIVTGTINETTVRISNIEMATPVK
jgi:hypothetical protein